MPVIIPAKTNSSATALAAISAAQSLDELKTACSILASAVQSVEAITADPITKSAAPVDAIPVDSIPVDAEPVAEPAIGGLG